jgi:imidazolonepropionase-like amidohydrolase
VGKLGVIEEGAYADILLADDYPLKDITVIGGNQLWLKAPKPADIRAIQLIMKDGVVYKNIIK